MILIVLVLRTKPSGLYRRELGFTWSRLHGRKYNIRIAKLVCSLVIETPSIPSQLDAGFYLHRRGRTSINSLASLCPL